MKRREKKQTEYKIDRRYSVLLCPIKLDVTLEKKVSGGKGKLNFNLFFRRERGHNK